MTIARVPSSFWLDRQVWNVVLRSDCQALTYFILNCRWMGCWFQICMSLPACFTPICLAEEWKLLNTGKKSKLTVLLPVPRDQTLPLVLEWMRMMFPGPMGPNGSFKGNFRKVGLIQLSDGYFPLSGQWYLGNTYLATSAAELWHGKNRGKLFKNLGKQTWSA